MSGRMAGKVAVVTGGANGIGLACVKRFHADGAKVAALDVEDDAPTRVDVDEVAQVATETLDDLRHLVGLHAAPRLAAHEVEPDAGDHEVVGRQVGALEGALGGRDELVAGVRP